MNNCILRFRRTSIATVIAALTFGLTTYAAPPKDIGPKVGDEAKDFELPNLSGEKVKLSTLAEKGSVVLLVLRGYPGYQCPLCSRQVAEFLGKADAFKKAGAQLVLIYPGPADGLKGKAEEFFKGKEYPANFTLLIDPDYTFTNAYGLRWDAPKETAYPSTYVLDSKRKVTFAKVSTTHGDRSKADDVLKALAAK